MEIEEPTRIKRAKEPVTPYEFCERFSKLCGMPVGYFLKMSKGFSMNTYHEIVSFAKASTNQKIAILKWYADYRKSIREVDNPPLKSQ